MGENQGMLWIILGVIVVAAAVMALGGVMDKSVDDAATQIENGEIAETPAA